MCAATRPIGLLIKSFCIVSFSERPAFSTAGLFLKGKVKEMSLFKQFATDQEKEIQGIWIKFAPNDDGTIPAFRIRRRSDRNQEHAAMLKRETEPYQQAIRLGTFDDMKSRAIYMRVFCTTVLIGWENIQDAEDKAIMYSTENACKLFNELPDLYDELLKQSDRVANFAKSKVEQERKN